MQQPNAVVKAITDDQALAYPFDVNQSHASLNQLLTRDKPTLIHIKASPAQKTQAERKQGDNNPIAELEMIGRKLSNFAMAKEGEIELVNATPEALHLFY